MHQSQFKLDPPLVVHNSFKIHSLATYLVFILDQEDSNKEKQIHKEKTSFCIVHSEHKVMETLCSECTMRNDVFFCSECPMRSDV